jgi:hypothetical protein
MEVTFLKSYQILTAFRVTTLVTVGPVPFRVTKPNGHIRYRSFQVSATVFKLLSCQLESSCYYLGLRWPDPVGECAADCVSVSAVRYRAFVFAAPQHRAAGNRPAKCRGAVPVGVVSPRAATPAKDS